MLWIRIRLSSGIWRSHWSQLLNDQLCRGSWVSVCQNLTWASLPQGKKRQYDQEVENLERQQKQTIERLEQEHTNRLRDEAKRIKAEQDKELSKYQNVLKNRKKEVRTAPHCFRMCSSLTQTPLRSAVFELDRVSLCCHVHWSAFGPGFTLFPPAAPQTSDWNNHS